MVSQIVSLITALILLAVAIASGTGRLPWWVVLIAVLVFVGWVGITFRSRLSTAIRNWLQRRHEQDMARQHWAELRRLTAELRTATESNRTEMASIIYNLITSIRPLVQDYYRPHAYKTEINNILTALMRLLDSQVRNKGTFIYSAQILENTLWLWHHDLVVKQAENLTKELENLQHKLDLNQKREYDKFRKWHCDLMDDYVRFAKGVNADFSEPVLRVTNYEPPPNVW